MAPAGSHHGIVAMRPGKALSNFIESHALGETFAAETGFKIASDPDTVRAPDLAVEVVSPGDTYSEVQDKVFDWLEAGTRLVIVADPRKRVVTVYHSLKEIEVLTVRDTLDGGDVVPGWRLPVEAIFGERNAA